MNHPIRAKGLVGRGMPPKIMFRDNGRERWLDVTSWQHSIAKEVARGLRQAELEAYRHGVSDAANSIGNRIHRAAAFPDAVDALKGALSEVLDLHRAGPR